MLDASDYHDVVSTVLDWDETTGTYTTTYDWSEVSPTTAIMESVSAVKGTSPLELDPLSEVTDPDALDTLLADSGGPLVISFRYGHLHATVRRDGRITLRPVDDAAEG